jgi:hypothetical protein
MLAALSSGGMDAAARVIVGLGGAAAAGVGFDQFLLGFRQYSARPFFDWGHLVFHIDRDQPIGPAIDGERNLLGRELPADLMLDRHERPIGNAATLHERPVAPAPHGDVGGDARAGAQAGDRRCAQIVAVP